MVLALNFSAELVSGSVTEETFSQPRVSAVHKAARVVFICVKCGLLTLVDGPAGLMNCEKGLLKQQFQVWAFLGSMDYVWWLSVNDQHRQFASILSAPRQW